VGFQPPGSANAPAIPRSEPRKIVFRNGGGEVVALAFAKEKKFLRDLCTDGVLPKVLFARPAIAVAEKSSQGITTAGPQWATVNIFWVGHKIKEGGNDGSPTGGEQLKSRQQSNEWD
jgi:hypothetical protein